MVIRALLLAFGLSACQMNVSPTTLTGQLTEPLPTVSLNGIEGRPFSYCWPQICADGQPGGGPVLSLPITDLTSSHEMTDIEVMVLRGENEREQVDPATLVLPEGEWEMVLVFAWFDGGDVAYVWTID